MRALAEMLGRSTVGTTYKVVLDNRLDMESERDLLHPDEFIVPWHAIFSGNEAKKFCKFEFGCAEVVVLRGLRRNGGGSGGEVVTRYIEDFESRLVQWQNRPIEPVLLKPEVDDPIQSV